MKKYLLILMSALALVFVLAGLAWSWQTSCSTTYSGGGWNSCTSTAITASGGTAASVYVMAPYSTYNCGTRSAYAKRSGDNWLMMSAGCPGGGGGGTAECCVRKSWTASNGTQYYVSASQTTAGHSSCGPTTGTINNTNGNCNEDSPEP